MTIKPNPKVINLWQTLHNHPKFIALTEKYRRLLNIPPKGFFYDYDDLSYAYKAVNSFYDSIYINKLQNDIKIYINKVNKLIPSGKHFNEVIEHYLIGGENGIKHILIKIDLSGCSIHKNKKGGLMIKTSIHTSTDDLINFIQRNKDKIQQLQEKTEITDRRYRRPPHPQRDRTIYLLNRFSKKQLEKEYHIQGHSYKEALLAKIMIKKFPECSQTISDSADPTNLIKTIIHRAKLRYRKKGTDN